MRVRIIEAAGLVILLAAFGQTALWTQGNATSSKTTRDGVYTSEQANQGASLYNDQCASCHGGSLEGEGESPALSGHTFVSDYGGATLDDLYRKIQTTMPQSNPGTLKPDQATQLIAYILSMNKYPSGGKALPSDPSILKSIRIDAPQNTQQ